MNCDDLLRLLADYAEGAGDECLCQEVERHLRECAPCETLREDLERVSRLCREGTPPRLPADVRARIVSLLRAESDS